MQQNYCEDDEIDLLDLAKKIWKYKKQICIVTCGFIAVGLLYILFATPWYKATALVEIGYYKETNPQSGLVQEFSLENPIDVTRKLQTHYIDLLKNTKELDYEVKKIDNVKDNLKFINLEVYGKSRNIAVGKISKIIELLAKEHKNILDAYLEKVKSDVENVNRQLNYLKNNRIVSVEQQIAYIKNYQIPRIDRSIKYMQEMTIPAAKKDLEAINNISMVAIDDNIKLNNDILQKYQKNLDELQSGRKVSSAESTISRQILEQGYYSQILNAKQNLISLEEQKNLLISQTIPNAQNRLDRLLNVDLENLQSDRDSIMTNKLPELQRNLINLQTSELNALLEKKAILELSLKPYNYQNTHIVAGIIASDYPDRPKKLIILVISMVLGLMISAFVVLIYDKFKAGSTENR
ncbi:MAG: chain length determinant protein [Campylobacter gracilis]|uniref:Wzz/FepE/Etk N-terminal domain-containing protein n=1 Tax=Campylobacter gracilis TaxID=824 RepID=UPI0026EDB9B2|nr:Wzz/FepE/Etk N-terminal domain-containing protein [Campylobacter gracilis]MBS6151996.1 chain length determinant protein [Campylobacter gracilis]